ncbi:MAG: class I SAM-dependent methyltransferase [Oligoflexia bacterium]|nr:class I SAM-dependent methyltransferase [Oligoflexia bacterium]
MQNIAKHHEAYYAPGSLSAKLEVMFKKDLFKLIRPTNGITLDLGCGLGEGFAFMGDHSKLIGLDFGFDILKETRRRFPNIPLLAGNLSQLPLRNNSIQRIICIAVLEHVFYLETAMAEIQRCLAEDGDLYVLVPTEGSLAVTAARWVTSQKTAKVMQITPKQAREAQSMDHCNTINLIEGVMRKYFSTVAFRLWPFKGGGIHVNLVKSYHLRQLKES